MHFELITVVPETVEGYLGASILGRAAEAGAVSFGVTPLRNFGEGRHRQVDDAPYGGGSGMVLQPGPMVAAIESALDRAEPEARCRTVLLSPAGRRLDRSLAGELARDVDHLVLVCGRYEGIDARVDAYVDESLSVGDFVLTGGELAALLVVDAVSRLLPGVLGNEESSSVESFEEGLLEYPQYTRPRRFRDQEVPAVLLSGDHAAIAAWRSEMALERTRTERPDLLSDRDTLPTTTRDLSEEVDGKAPGE